MASPSHRPSRSPRGPHDGRALPEWDPPETPRTPRHAVTRTRGGNPGRCDVHAEAHNTSPWHAEPMAGVSLGRVRDRARAAFWLVPAVCGIGAVGLAIGLGRLDRLIGDTEIVFLFPGPPEGARSFLGAIIGAMISFHRRPVLQWLDVVHKGTKPVPGRSA